MPRADTAGTSANVVLAASESSMKRPSFLRSSVRKAMPAASACAGERIRRSLPSTVIFPPSMRIGAGDRPRELGPAASDEAREADDLALADASARRR